ncbi:MAG: NlpC/P60 family protein [Pseudomonadota bacterium]
MDRRLTPARGDIAAAHLKGVVEAERYVDGTPMQISASVAPIRRTPADDGLQETQTLYGETFVVYDERDGWCWGQAAFDDYVGYVAAEALSHPVDPVTHRVSALRTYLYSEPDLKSAPFSLISMNAKLAVGDADASGKYLKTARGGWVHAGHVRPIGEREDDFVAVAERFLGAPYFWGGRESLGLDCSALVQNALEAAGVRAPRDTDMQISALGETVVGDWPDIALKRGDLVFWNGHVAIMTDGVRMIHANATHMCVSIDDARAFSERIREKEGPVTRVARLSA